MLRGLSGSSLLLPPLHGVGRLFLYLTGHCRTLYKMMPLEDVRLQVIRILRGHAAELQQAAHARRRVRALEQKKNLEG